MTRRIYRWLLPLMGLMVLGYLIWMRWTIAKGITFNIYEPAHYKSVVNHQLAHPSSWCYRGLLSAFSLICMMFLGSIGFYRAIAKKSRTDRLYLIAFTVLFIIAARERHSMPTIGDKEIVENYMNQFSLGMSGVEDSLGGGWTGVLKVTTPEFDKVIVHVQLTILYAAVGLKNEKVVSYFLYSPKLERYKVLDVDLIENKYKSRAQMWTVLIAAKTISDLGKLASLQGTLSGHMGDCQDKSLIPFFEHVSHQFYDDLAEIIKITNPEVHIPSRLENSQKALRNSH